MWDVSGINVGSEWDLGGISMGCGSGAIAACGMRSPAGRCDSNRSPLE